MRKESMAWHRKVESSGEISGQIHQPTKAAMIYYPSDFRACGWCYDSGKNVLSIEQVLLVLNLRSSCGLLTVIEENQIQGNGGYNAGSLNCLMLCWLWSSFSCLRLSSFMTSVHQLSCALSTISTFYRWAVKRVLADWIGTVCVLSV